MLFFFNESLHIRKVSKDGLWAFWEERQDGSSALDCGPVHLPREKLPQLQKMMLGRLHQGTSHLEEASLLWFLSLLPTLSGYLVYPMWAAVTLAGVDKSGGRGETTEQSHRYQRVQFTALLAASLPGLLHSVLMRMRLPAGLGHRLPTDTRIIFHKSLDKTPAFPGVSRVGEASSLGQPALHAQLFLELRQLGQANVAAPTNDDHEGGQWGTELPLSLQLLNHVAVDGGQGCPTGGLHQDLLLICQRRGMVRVEPEFRRVQGNSWATGKA